MTKINILLVSLISFLLTSLVSPAIASNKNYQSIDKTNQKAILFYVNQYRAKHGLGPLKLNAQMSREAEQHSRDMANHKMGFGHKGFNKRIKHLFEQIKQCRGGAENVAYNYKDGKDVVKNWLTSRGHRINIEGHYNLTGIGLARDKRGKLYFTQIFIRTDNPKYR